MFKNNPDSFRYKVLNFKTKQIILNSELYILPAFNHKRMETPVMTHLLESVCQQKYII